MIQSSPNNHRKLRFTPGAWGLRSQLLACDTQHSDSRPTLGFCERTACVDSVGLSHLEARSLCSNQPPNISQNLPASAGDTKDVRGQEDPWSRKWQLAPGFLPGKSHGQRSLVGYSPRGHRVRHNWATEHTYCMWWEEQGKLFISNWVRLTEQLYQDEY